MSEFTWIKYNKSQDDILKSLKNKNIYQVFDLALENSCVWLANKLFDDGVKYTDDFLYNRMTNIIINFIGTDEMVEIFKLLHKNMECVRYVWYEDLVKTSLMWEQISIVRFLIGVNEEYRESLSDEVKNKIRNKDKLIKVNWSY